VPDFTAGNTDMCYPFVSSVNRYAFGANGLRTVDENGLLTTDKIQTSDLKPALRAIRIIEAIEEKYSIVFESDFLKNNAIFTELYLWLNRSKGVLADAQTFDLSYRISGFSFSSDAEVLNLASEFIITELSQNGTNINDFVKFNFQYDVEVIGNGGIELQIIDAVTNQIFATFSGDVEDETVSISFLFESVNFGSDLFRPLLRVITDTELITEIDINLTVTKSQRQNTVPFTQIGNYSLTGGSVVAISEVNVALQVPSMLILDFLNSIFKTFNLTAFVQKNGSIKVQPLDEFYSEGKVMDITNLIDINKSEVKRFEPYKDINFEFEKAESFLMIKRDKILDDVFGNLNFEVGADDPSKVISGGAYNVKPKFHKILPERLRIEDGSLSPIMYSWYVNEDQEPLSNQPIIFYTKRQEFTGSDSVEFQNRDNLTSNIAPSNVKQDLTQTINYGAEIDEYTLEVNNNSLFNNLYRKFILGAFSPRSKILKVKAYLNADFILNYELNGTFIINGRKFNINTLDVNLGTGEANLELRNIFDISAIPTPDAPTVDELTISSPSQSENDASGSYTFDVISNVSWTVSESSDFISVSPVSGSNNETLTITYDENTTTDTRAGVITVTGGGFVREHTLTQAGKEVQLTISSSSNTVTKEAGDYTIQIISNTDWVVTDDKSWISESPTNGFGDATLTISRSENLSTNIRQAIIEVQAGSVVRTHTLTQQAQSSTQLYPHDLKQGDTASIACARTSTQTYYTDESFYDNSNLIFFDSNGNNKVPSGFFAKGIRVLETNNNGQVIDSGRC
jgi:hypothetical protein